MLSMATVPAKTIKSPQDSPTPYFSFNGRNKCLALSKLVLSAQLRSGSNRCLAPSQPPRPSEVRYDPAQCQNDGGTREIGGRESSEVPGAAAAHIFLGDRSFPEHGEPKNQSITGKKITDASQRKQVGMERRPIHLPDGLAKSRHDGGILRRGCGRRHQ